MVSDAVKPVLRFYFIEKFKNNGIYPGRATYVI